MPSISPRLFLPLLLTSIGLLLSPRHAAGQEWSDPVRGSWVRDGEAQAGDVVLAGDKGLACEIVIPPDAPGPIVQAAQFLAGDIEKLSGHRPPITAVASGDRVAIHLGLVGGAQPLPAGVHQDKLKGQWEAHQILTDGGRDVWLVGADARGAAFAAYTLSERLGIDPLHLWTGYEPQRRDRLILKQTDHLVGPPTVKYRGMFHDDEDILPRPFEYSGYPLRHGDVPLSWYARFFETALRLRMNMVAPYTRVHRRYEVQKMASDWGLFYTSHHYDILLSNPYGFTRYGLAKQRGVTGDWNWLTNREGMLTFWRGGVEENKDLYCIWPVGLRGTDDYAYPFPKDMPQEQQNRIFREAIEQQIETTKKLAPPDKPPVFHFTLYNEMLEKYLHRAFEMPQDVILVWPDNNDGRLRALPKDRGQWKHGVYYHLAYLGPVAKQNMRFVSPTRVANEFKRITDAGATEYVLFNVSELREFVMEARMIAEVCWDARAALHDTPSRPETDEVLPAVPPADQPAYVDPASPSADRYVRWWAAEYFGADAAADVAEISKSYFLLHDRWDKQWLASDKVSGAIDTLIKRLAGQEFAPARDDTLPMLRDRDKRYAELFARIDRVRPKMNRQQRQFFFEHVEFPLLVTWRQTQAAIPLVQAIAEPDREKVWSMCESAMRPLEQLELDILRVERPPFEQWYRHTWIRNEETGLNLHRPYEQLRLFLSSGGTQRLTRPPEWARPDLAPFNAVLKEHLP